MQKCILRNQALPSRKVRKSACLTNPTPVRHAVEVNATIYQLPPFCSIGVEKGDTVRYNTYTIEYKEDVC
jgi:hypothetical protein